MPIVSAGWKVMGTLGGRGVRRCPPMAILSAISACPGPLNMVDSAAMKQYVIDELNSEDRQAIGQYLARHAQPAGVDGLYWLPIEDGLLAAEQQSHDACKPFFFALELMPNRLVCELLVRTCNRVRCSCIAYADRQQREWLIETIDAILDKLGIKT